MSEANEQPVPHEAKKESRVVGKVREAVQKGWERIKIDEKIYDELYAGSQPGLEWHGKGIYKLWTENADQVIKLSLIHI